MASSRRTAKNERVSRGARESLKRVIEAPTTDLGPQRLAPTALAVTTGPIVARGFRSGVVQQTGPSGAVRWTILAPPGSVEITLVRIPNTGGHSHGEATSDPLAVGMADPSLFVIPNGSYGRYVVHRVTDVCGSIRFVARHSNGSGDEGQTDVVLAGLQPIPTSAALSLKAPEAVHPTPYWGAPDFIAKLVDLANRYFVEAGRAIVVTDGCLPTGGRFDLDQDWQPPHHEHTDGHQADIRSNDMTSKETKMFLDACAAAGLSVLVESNHWHVRG